MNAEIVSTHTPALFSAGVKRVANLLRAGEVVALPTETVYGLAANALDPKAVARIYEIKGRPPQNPIIVHVASLELARRCVATWPDQAGKLASAFWPGPLTLVLPRSKEIPDIVTAGGDTVGVRWPSHPFILAVIRECGFPLAAPSANLANRLSPTCVEHVLSQLGDRVSVLADGGACPVGIESTVLDLTSSPPNVLRPGMIHDAALAAVLGEVRSEKVEGRSSDAILRSPGLLRKHYAPKAKLVVLSWRDEAELRQQLSTLNSQLSTCCVVAHTRIPSTESFAGVSVIPHEPIAFARAIYGELHRCDDAGAAVIVIEAPPDSIEWAGIADRLRRAAGA